MINNLIIKINKNIVVLQIIILAVFITNSNIHLPCLPAIQASYHTTEYTIQIAFIINAFVAMFASFFYGAAADFYGRKQVLMCSLLFLIMGTFFIIYYNSLGFFFLGRFLQSLGDAGGAVVCGVIIGDFYKGKEYARIQAILSIVLSLAWACAPLLGGKIFALFGWKGNFILVFILLILVSFPIIFWQDKKRIKKQQHSLFQGLVKTGKAIKTKFGSYFIMISLLQALPMGLFMAFELMLPFIYKKGYGYSIERLSIFFFIFVLINILGSLTYMLIIKQNPLKTMFRISRNTLLLYLILGLVFFTLFKSTSELIAYPIYGLLSFILPFMVISSSTRIVDSYGQHLGIAFALLAIIRNAGTTVIPLLSCVLSQNSFYSLFNITLLPTVLTIWLLFRILKY